MKKLLLFLFLLLATAAAYATCNPTITVTVLPNDTICSGLSVTFTAVKGGSGTVTLYRWKKNRLIVGTNSTTYTSSSIAANDTVTCTVVVDTTGLGCASIDSATSADKIMRVIAQSATQTVSPNDTICQGIPVTFTAVPNYNIGQTYRWYKNTTLIGTASYTTTSVLATGNTIKCLLSNTGCANDTTNVVTMKVYPYVTALVSAVGRDNICGTDTITYSLTKINGGTSPAYVWYRNDTARGTGTTYTTDTLVTGTTIRVRMISNVRCPTPASDTAYSPYLRIKATTYVTPAITSATVAPNDTVTYGTNCIFKQTNTNGGANPAYRWYANDTLRASSWIYQTAVLHTGNNKIYFKMTSTLPCVTTPTAVSDTIRMKVN